MTTGAGTISVTTSNGTSQSLPFYCRPLGTNNIYFVSPSGSDANPGTTTASPWATFTKVRQTLTAGDIAYFRNGSWTADDGNGAVVRFSAGNHQNGTVNKSIAVTSYPGEVAQIGDSITSMTSIRHSQWGGTGGPDALNYWTFSKFNTRADTYWPNNGDQSSDDHLRFIGNDFSVPYDVHANGADFSGYQTYFSFYGNYNHDAGGSNPTSRAYGLYMDGYGVSHDIDIGWNEFAHNANGRGMQIYGHLVGDSLDQVFVHDNYFHHNGLTGAILGGGDGGSNYEFIKNLYFYNNIVANNGIRPGEPHDGIRLDGGLSWGGWGGNFRIYNNTFYNNTEGEVEWYLPSGTTPIRASFMNNIFITASQYNTNSCNATVCSGSNNAYYGMGNGPSWVTASLNANPLLVNPAAGDFHLNTTSPAKDAGSSSVAAVVTKDYDGNTRPMGAGYDIGAYEYAGPAVPMLQFSSAAYSVSEGTATATINVTRIGSSVGAVAVNYATSNGTATAGSDYTAASGTLNWADGDVATKSFTVSITNDTVVESNETINITLTSPTNGALLGSPSSVVLTITDNDSTGGGGSGSGGDSGGGSGGGGGCGYIKDDGKGQKTKGEGLSLMIMLIITLAGIALRKITAELKMRSVFYLLKNSLYFLVFAILFALIAACGSGGGGDSSNSSNSSSGGSGGGTNNGAATINMVLPQENSVGAALDTYITLQSSAPLNPATVSASTFYVRGPGNSAITATVSYQNQAVTIRSQSALQPLTTYSVVCANGVKDANGQDVPGRTWSFTTTNAAGNPLPLMGLWESQMVTAGNKWGQYLQNPNISQSAKLDADYYDGERTFYQIADYLGQAEPWTSYAKAAQVVYRDNYCIPINYGTAGHQRFPDGIYQDFVRNNDATSAAGIVLMRDRPVMSDPDTSPYAYAWYWQKFSREVAYAIGANILAERAGNPRQTQRMQLYIAMAMNHLSEWRTQQFGDPDPAWHFAVPFMFGLTADALISYYEWEVEQGHNPDETIPNAIKATSDWMWTAPVVDQSGKFMWIPDLGGSGGAWTDTGGAGFGGFRYADRTYTVGGGGGPAPAPDLNLLIAPAYAWLYKHFGDPAYRNKGDLIWKGGVAPASADWSGKLFNQQYRLSFNYVKWRQEGLVKWGN